MTGLLKIKNNRNIIRMGINPEREILTDHGDLPHKQSYLNPQRILDHL